MTLLSSSVILYVTFYATYKVECCQGNTNKIFLIVRVRNKVYKLIKILHSNFGHEKYSQQNHDSGQSPNQPHDSVM